MIRILDRLLFRTFLKLFLGFVLGAPVLFVVGDIVQEIDHYFARGLTFGDVALAYMYKFPMFVSWAFPIAALIAAVFTVHGMTVHREVMAAKAGGISFHRLILPILVAGAGLAGAGLLLAEVVPLSNRRAARLLQSEDPGLQWRHNFVFKTDEGVSVSIRRLNAPSGEIGGVIMEIPPGPNGEPAEHMSAKRAVWRSNVGWTFEDGFVRVLSSEIDFPTYKFSKMRTAHFSPPPRDLLTDFRNEEEMTRADIDRLAANIERSGGDASELYVEKNQRTALAIATLIIILFGAPLATSTQRGGTAYGIGLALATTLLYLLLFKLTKAAGESGVMAPMMAAWSPNAVFLLAALVLLKRVRT
ncbi:MAG: LptF/LptG family permease [Gemmatimonadetes bacterium]|nr:LptF/LptG family permease [Gemmatimonadota bacterium]